MAAGKARKDEDTNMSKKQQALSIFVHQVYIIFLHAVMVKGITQTAPVWKSILLTVSFTSFFSPYSLFTILGSSSLHFAMLIAVKHLVSSIVLPTITRRIEILHRLSHTTEAYYIHGTFLAQHLSEHVPITAHVARKGRLVAH